MYLLNLFRSFQSSASESLFTFHYVSIKSMEGQDAVQTFNEFTFHYVSIKSQISADSTNKLGIFTFHYVSIKSFK